MSELANAATKGLETSSSRPVETAARKGIGKKAGKKAEEKAGKKAEEKAEEKGATTVTKVAPKAKTTRKAQIQALVGADPDEKENEAPGLFTQGTFTGPHLSLVAYIVFKYYL